MAQGTAPLASYDPLAPIQALTDPSAIEFVASQLNDSTLNQNIAQGAPTCNDLTDAILDITIETAAQGASIITVQIMDPWWQLTHRFGANPAFIDVDDSGLLIPVDVNFPASTDSWWRLCAAEPSLDTTGANLVLTFEDRIVTELRDLAGPRVASKNQTRAQFILACVRQVPDIRFVCPALALKAGAVAGDVTQGQILQFGNPAPAKSSKQSDAPSARRNPTKKPGIGSRQGATWTKGGWRYTKPIDGLTPKELSILNPPTNQPDR